MNELEKQFQQELLNACEISKQELHYNPTYFLRMLYELGAVEAAKRLVGSPEPAEGFTNLFLHQRLGLSVEAHVIKGQYKDLFSPEDIEKARKRLDAYEFFGKKDKSV